MSVHFSSQRLDWKTPKAVYQVLDSEFRFDFDPCPASEFDYRMSGGKTILPLFGEEYAVDSKYDGLTVEWGRSNFINPPYGSELPKWLQKGYEEAKKGKLSVFLIPSRTDTDAWHRYILPFTGGGSVDGDIAWSAGIVDGEGCIFIKKDAAKAHTRHRSDIYSLGLKVTMTHELTVRRLQEIFNTGTVIHATGRGGRKDSYSWTVRSHKAHRVIQLLYPYLLTKEREAFTAIEFGLLESDRRGRKLADAEKVALRAKYYDKLRSLKKASDDIHPVHTEIRFIKGRLKFDDQENSAPFPSAIVIFRSKK